MVTVTEARAQEEISFVCATSDGFADRFHKLEGGELKVPLVRKRTGSDEAFTQIDASGTPADSQPVAQRVSLFA
jgi:hypothetical protein